MPMATRKQSATDCQPSPSKSTAGKKSKATSKTASGAKTKRQIGLDKKKQEQEQGDKFSDSKKDSAEPEVKVEDAAIFPKTFQPEKPGEAAEAMKHLDQRLQNGSMADVAARDRNDRPAVSPTWEVNAVLGAPLGPIDRLGSFQKLGKHLDNFAGIVENADSIRDSAVKAQQNHNMLLSQVKNLNTDMMLMRNDVGHIQRDITWIRGYLNGMKHEVLGQKTSLFPALQPVAQLSAVGKRSHADASPEHDDDDDQESGRSPTKRSMVNPGETSKPIETSSSASPLTDPAHLSFLTLLQDEYQFSDPPQDESLGDRVVPDDDVASEDSAATKDAEDVGAGSVVAVQSVEEGQEAGSLKA